MRRFFTILLTALAVATVQATTPISPYAFQGGKVHISGRVTSPDSTATIPDMFLIRTENIFDRMDMNHIVEIDADGYFATDVELPHPIITNGILDDLLLIPGDTISMSCDVGTKHMEIEGSEAAIRYNELCHTTDIKELLNDLPLAYFLKLDSREELQQYIDTLTSRIDRYMISHPADTAQTDPGIRIAEELSRIKPVAYALLNIYELTMRHKDTKYIASFDKETAETTLTENPDYMPLDLTGVSKLICSHPESLVDNPVLFIVDPYAKILINRIEYEEYLPLMLALSFTHNPTEIAEASLREKLRQISDTHGYPPESVLTQICLCRNFFNNYKLKTPGVWFNDSTGTRAEEFISTVMPLLTNPVAARNIAHAYREMVKNTESGNLTDTNPIPPTLAKLIEPYEGYALFVDFWSMGCGPCRMGMLRQRDDVTYFADKPVKFLYISYDSETAKAEEWLAENKIGGEHIFIPYSDWQRLEGELNFSGIPFTLLIDSKHSFYKESNSMSYRENIESILQ